MTTTYTPEEYYEMLCMDDAKPPKMVFSVLGDSNTFVPVAWPKHKFQRALSYAADVAGETWIFFGGEDFGVSKIVRDAIKDNNLLKLLENVTKLESITEEKQSELDLCLEGNNGKGFHENLVELEGYISNKSVEYFRALGPEILNTEMVVPVLLVVVEGDIETIKHVGKALQKGLPVLIVKGSGKAADLISEYLENTTDDKETILKQRAALLFGLILNLKTLKKDLNEIEERKWLVTLFDVNTEDHEQFSKKATDVLIQAWATKEDGEYRPENMARDQETNVPLPAEYNDTASNSTQQTSNTEKTGSAVRLLSTKINILTTSASHRSNTMNKPSESVMGKVCKPGNGMFVKELSRRDEKAPLLYFYLGFQYLQEHNKFDTENAQNLLLEALIAKQHAYVQELLDRGVMLTLKHLSQLYDKTIACSCKPEDDCLHTKWIFKRVNENAADVVFGKEENGKTTNEKKDLKYKAVELCRKFLGYKDNSKASMSKSKVNPNEQSKECADSDDLLLWSLFENDKEFAFMFWQKTKSSLLTGLICTMLLRKLSKKTANVKEYNRSKELEHHATIFEHRCLTLMTDLFEFNQKVAIQIIKQKENCWAIETNPISFAYENYMYKIVAHNLSQRHLNRKWYKKQPPDLLPFIQSCRREPATVLSSPFMRFIIHYIFFACMLVAYSAYVLTSVDDLYYRRTIARVWEYYIYIWAGGDLIEEVRLGMGILSTENKSHRGYRSRLKRYLWDFWNVVIIISYLLLIIALLVRHIIPTSDDFKIARRLFSVSLIVMYIRFLQVFTVSRRLGPNLMMIKRMLVDMLYFLVIAGVCITGVGVYYHANLFPSHINIFGPGEWTDWRIWDILYYPYWQLYGEGFNSFLEGKELDDCSTNSSVWLADTSVDRCPEKEWSVAIVSGVYMMISNLLLVNLVIAMFSYTFEKVQTDSEMLWRFERYKIIADYASKIPSPINIFILPAYCITCGIKEKKPQKCLQKLQQILSKRLPYVTTK